MIDIADLISKIDIVEYISRYLSFEEKNGEYFSVCPFHNEKTASFSITPSTQLYYCFGCSSSGNILNFIQMYHNVDFKKALEIAIEYIGGDIKELPISLEATKQIKKFKTIEKEIKPIKYKKLLDDVMTRYDFNLQKLQLWLNEGISLDVLKRYQVKYDPFSNRIVFPIWNEFGDIINVKGRTLEENFKEKDIEKYYNFYKIGRCDYIYNLNFAKEEIKKKNRVIIFESEKAVMLAETYGIKNTIALMTSHLNDDQMKLLIKLGANCIFALDKNVDIKKDENIMKLKKYMKVQYIKDKWDLIGEKDAPIDHGYDTFKQLYLKRFTL